MTFKEAYKKIKKLPERNFLHRCHDCGDLWGFTFTSEFIPQGVSFAGGGHFINKENSELVNPFSVYTDPNRSKPTPIPVPRFAAEGWDYYDDKTDTFKLKPNAPYWAKNEFDEFYETGRFGYEPAQVAEPGWGYGAKQ
jgi:hypothetical protein